jgi:predicted DNA-binding transcriptional regulator YafY
VARSERLLELIRVLRRHRRPVSGQTLAAELGVSPRSVYRDIQTLRRQGASIDGEAGDRFRAAARICAAAPDVLR